MTTALMMKTSITYSEVMDMEFHNAKNMMSTMLEFLGTKKE